MARQDALEGVEVELLSFGALERLAQFRVGARVDCHPNARALRGGLVERQGVRRGDAAQG